MSHRFKLWASSLLGACALAYALAWGLVAWSARETRNAFQAQRDQALALGLTYDAVLIASDQMSNRPVLWRLSRTAGEDWFYEGDMNKRIWFTNRPALPHEGRRGMESWTILGLVRGGSPQGVFLQFLRAY